MIGRLHGGPAGGLECDLQNDIAMIVKSGGQAVEVKVDWSTGGGQKRCWSQYWRRDRRTNIWEWVPTYPRERFEFGFPDPPRPRRPAKYGLEN